MPHDAQVGTVSVKPAASNTLRTGSIRKRASIIAAARQLFTTDGYERTSVDGVAALAQVSKRTIYDYYGDKQRLLIAVVDELAQEVGAVVDRALQHLDDETDLESALRAFAVTITESALGSDAYRGLFKLMTAETLHVPDLGAHWAHFAPEDKLIEHLERLEASGELSFSDPRVAAEHLVALTLGTAIERAFSTGDTAVDDYRIELGVRAFIRAYRA